MFKMAEEEKKKDSNSVTETKQVKENVAKPQAKEKKVKDKKPENVKVEKSVEDPFEVIKFVLMTEKSVQMIEMQNKLVFIVSRKSQKKDIMKSVETAFSYKVTHVNTSIDQKGRKKAFVKFLHPEAAGEIAIKLGIL